jgi:adenylylsulfate kinase
MARAGEIQGFTGIDDPYEEPLNPEIVCYTAQETVEESVAKVINHLDLLGYLPLKPAQALTYVI